jgi:membrane protein
VRKNRVFALVVRNRKNNFLFLGLDLVFAISLYLVRRFSKSWMKSLRPARVTLHDLRSSGQEKQEFQSKEPTKDRRYLTRIFDGLTRAFGEWNQDKCPQLGAALAYYTVFSLAPLILVLLAVFGWLYGSSENARQKVLEQLQYFFDPSGLKVIQDIASNAAQPKTGILAAVIGILIALVGASGIFGQLQDALNTIWNVKPKPNLGIWGFIRARFLSFAMVIGVCFLLLVSLVMENVLRGLHNLLEVGVPGGHYVGLAVFYLFDLVIVASLFAMIFRYLPDAKIAWRDVWTGAGLTAVSFLIGKFLLGLYLSIGTTGSAYGAASSLVALLLWVFYSAQILLLGAEFTKVYANAYGSRVEPSEHAVKVEKKQIEIR